MNETGAHEVIDLKARQHTFAKVVERSFLDLEFDERKAIRWFLLPDKLSVVADPSRSFGQPITNEGGVPTKRIAQALNVEGSVAKVAKFFEIASNTVRDAVKFEAQLRTPLAT